MKRILLVEDNQMNRALMRDILKYNGYEVDVATDGEEAMEKIKSEKKYDLMLLDIQLPKISGYKILEKMDKKIRTIVVSACAMDDEIKKAKRLGCVDYVKKPINIADFIGKVKYYLC